MAQTIFITGASSGLGKATAKLFAKKSWNVIATMRNPSAETELSQINNIRLLALDVTSPAQIDQVVKNLVKTQTVDVVFNNAGYGLGGPFEGATEEQLQQQLNTNLMGVMSVTKAFLPHFREKKKGMFITTTSIGGHVAFPFFSVYHATKWALEGWSESLSYELSLFGIQVKSIAPGGIKTDFAGRSLVMTEHPAFKESLDKAYAAFTDPKRQKDYSTPEQIAETVFKAATDGKKQLRYIAGKDANTLYRVRRMLGYKFFMNQVSKAFFN
jgi:NAD(P)-dependent dehydrogenase (short-subunit alcohol dehydrogenase family)